MRDDHPMTDSVPPDSASPQPVPPKHKGGKVEASAVGYAWTGLILGALLLILLLIFILQNLNTTTVYLFFWDFSLPLGVGVLLAAITGALLMAIVGGARILQLRHLAKKNGRHAS